MSILRAEWINLLLGYGTGNYGPGIVLDAPSWADVREATGMSVTFRDADQKDIRGWLANIEAGGTLTYCPRVLNSGRPNPAQSISWVVHDSFGGSAGRQHQLRFRRRERVVEPDQPDDPSDDQRAALVYAEPPANPNHPAPRPETAPGIVMPYGGGTPAALDKWDGTTALAALTDASHVVYYLGAGAWARWPVSSVAARTVPSDPDTDAYYTVHFGGPPTHHSISATSLHQRHGRRAWAGARYPSTN